MPEYYTYKKDAQAAAKPGQTVDFTAGRGYYLAGTPTPAKPTSAPKQVSDAASGGGYVTTTAATPATKQPTAAVAPPRTPLTKLLPRHPTTAEIAAAQAQGHTLTAIANHLGLNKSTISRRLRHSASHTLPTATSSHATIQT